MDQRRSGRVRPARAGGSRRRRPPAWGRVQRCAVGSPWQPGSGHTITRSYSVNTLNEVSFFSYDPASSSVSLSSDPVLKYYAVNQLYANHTQDEKQNEVIEYTDKLGHTVCKKVQSGTSGATKLYASTYYLYDDLGNLVVVIPPEGVKAITGN